MLDSPVPEAPAATSQATGVDAGTIEDRARELDVIDAELDAVERALARLDDGTYWTCEATGGELPDALLSVDPLARRIPPPPAPAIPSSVPGPAATERSW